MPSASDCIDQAPLHHQVRRALLAMIEQLELKPGDQLPPENVLWARFKVSRQTLRQAVDSLVRDHVLYRHHPKGTFVGYGAVEGDLQTLRSVWEDIRRLGMEPGARVIGIRTRKAAEVSASLEVSPESDVIELQRVFTANGDPISFDTAYFPTPEFAWLLGEDVAGSWYEILAKHGIALSHARTNVDATSATDEVARHLGVDRGTALLCLRRKTYARSGNSQRNHPIAYTVALFLTDRYQFSVVLSRR